MQMACNPALQAQACVTFSSIFIDAMQDQRQVGMVRNPGVRLKCDQQSAEAWFRSWERASATTADFCDAGGAGELAVKAMFPHMQRWAYNLQASHCCKLLLQQPLVQVTEASQFGKSLLQVIAASHCCKSSLQLGSASCCCKSLMQVDAATH